MMSFMKFLSVFFTVLAFSFSHPLFAKVNCELSFLKSLQDTLAKNKYYSLIEDGVSIENGEVKTNLLNSRILSISTLRDGEARAVFFLGRDSLEDENSYVYSMVNQRNKIFNSVSRQGIKDTCTCSIVFTEEIENNLMTIRFSLLNSVPYISFSLDDGSYIKYKFHKGIKTPE